VPPLGTQAWRSRAATCKLAYSPPGRFAHRAKGSASGPQTMNAMAESTASIDAEVSGPQLSIADGIDIVRRNFWYFLIPTVLLLVAGLLYVRSLPAIYVSTAKILVESQQIPEDLVRSTVTSFADERIEFIRQKVLTRTNILEMVDEFELYERADLSRTEQVIRFLENVGIDRVSANTRQGQTTVAFDLSFRDLDPRTAQLVASELATHFLDENAATRTARATETTAFLRREAEQIQEQIREAETQISTFKVANRDQLPELFQVNMGRLGRVENEYQQASLTLAGLERELRFLYAQAEGRALAPTRRDSADPNAPATLEQLRAERDRLLLQLTETHPDVLNVQRRIEAREAAIAALPPEPENTQNITPESVTADLDRILPASVSPTLAREIETVRERIRFLRRSLAQMAEEIEVLEERLNQAPAIEREWQDLQRGLSNLSAKYEELRNKELEARMAQTLEEERKGERFVLLEPPVVPTEPSEPNLKKLYVMVLGLAGAAGACLMALVEFSRPGMRGEGIITHHLGTIPLASIPYIQTPAEEAQRLRRRKQALVALALSPFLAAAFVHFLVYPLDLLYYEAMRTLGAG
jgi:polysaccharide chain length determinant protein (PEP-CTERM system associated)